MAIIRGTAILATFALSIHFISKTVKIDLDRKATWKTLAASAIMALTVAIAQQIVYNVQFLPAYIAIGAAAYAITTRTLKTLNKEDTQFIKEIAGQKTANLITKILVV